MLNGQTLKSATSDYDQRHVIAFRPISVAARSWSYDNMYCFSMALYQFWAQPFWGYVKLTLKGMS